MSYLQMASAPVPNMTRGIISLWFRDATGKAGVVPPPPTEFPSGLWEPNTQSMVPPWVAKVVQNLDDWPVFFWDAYGVPNQIFGGLITGAATVVIPTPPFFPTDSIRMLMSFGNPGQPYNYCPWEIKDTTVIDAVQYVSSQGFIIQQTDAPYLLYNRFVGDEGKFKVKNFQLGSAVSKPDFVPQSFIGVDKDGYLIICLQTDTKATYKGFAFQMDEITELWASRTEMIINEPHTYEQIGWPFPDGHWVSYPGFWNGYQFTYKDISQEVMAVQPETFVIGGPQTAIEPGGPRVGGDTWHHVLFSFDLTGSVSVDHPENNTSDTFPTARSSCQAWLAVDDRNYDGSALQRRLRIPDGIIAPLLPGVGHDAFPYGPTTSFNRYELDLARNEIVPQNAWLRAFFRCPKQDLLRFAANATVVDETTDFTPAGDFDPFSGWTGAIWPLYGNGVAPGPWLGSFEPPHPTVPDPKDLDLPKYSCSGFNIPVEGHPIGIPASSHHLAHNTGVEMAELQIWANKTVDTSIEEMRRLFIDKDGRPTPPGVAEDVLGKPDVLLHGSGNWKAGINTGKSGFDAKGNPFPPQFNPVASIESFIPDPELGK